MSAAMSGCADVVQRDPPVLRREDQGARAGVGDDVASPGLTQAEPVWDRRLLVGRPDLLQGLPVWASTTRDNGCAPATTVRRLDADGV